jgi:hypothetical protein
MIGLYGSGMAFERGSARIECTRLGMSLGGGIAGGIGAGYAIYPNDDADSELLHVVDTGLVGVFGALGGALAVALANRCAQGALHMVGRDLLAFDLKRMASSISGDVPPALKRLRDDTLDALWRVQKQMHNGAAGAGPGKYPNFAELAQARASVQFIQQMRGAG